MDLQTREYFNISGAFLWQKPTHRDVVCNLESTASSLWFNFAVSMSVVGIRRFSSATNVRFRKTTADLPEYYYLSRRAIEYIELDIVDERTEGNCTRLDLLNSARWFWHFEVSASEVTLVRATENKGEVSNDRLLNEIPVNMRENLRCFLKIGVEQPVRSLLRIVVPVKFH